MHTQFETLLLDGDSKSDLKAAIKQVIREMAAKAAVGKVELPTGMDAAEDVVLAYKERLMVLDSLLNPLSMPSPSQP